MRTILSALVLSTLGLAAPMVHADEAKVAPAATEKAPVAEKSTVEKTSVKKSSGKTVKKSESKSEAKPAAQPRRVKSVRRVSKTTTVVK